MASSGMGRVMRPVLTCVGVLAESRTTREGLEQTSLHLAGDYFCLSNVLDYLEAEGLLLLNEGERRQQCASRQILTSPLGFSSFSGILSTPQDPQIFLEYLVDAVHGAAASLQSSSHSLTNLSPPSPNDLRILGDNGAFIMLYNTSTSKLHPERVKEHSSLAQHHSSSNGDLDIATLSFQHGNGKSRTEEGKMMINGGAPAVRIMLSRNKKGDEEEDIKGSPFSSRKLLPPLPDIVQGPRIVKIRVWGKKRPLKKDKKGKNKDGGKRKEEKEEGNKNKNKKKKKMETGKALPHYYQIAVVKFYFDDGTSKEYDFIANTATRSTTEGYDRYISEDLVEATRMKEEATNTLKRDIEKAVSNGRTYHSFLTAKSGGDKTSAAAIYFGPRLNKLYSNIAIKWTEANGRYTQEEMKLLKGVLFEPTINGKRRKYSLSYRNGQQDSFSFLEGEEMISLKTFVWKGAEIGLEFTTNQGRTVFFGVPGLLRYPASTTRTTTTTTTNATTTANCCYPCGLLSQSARANEVIIGREFKCSDSSRIVGIKLAKSPTRNKAISSASSSSSSSMSVPPHLGRICGILDSAQWAEDVHWEEAVEMSAMMRMYEEGYRLTSIIPSDNEAALPSTSSTSSCPSSSVMETELKKEDNPCKLRERLIMRRRRNKNVNATHTTSSDGEVIHPSVVLVRVKRDKVVFAGYRTSLKPIWQALVDSDGNLTSTTTFRFPPPTVGVESGILSQHPIFTTITFGGYKIGAASPVKATGDIPLGEGSLLILHRPAAAAAAEELLSRAASVPMLAMGVAPKMLPSFKEEEKHEEKHFGEYWEWPAFWEDLDGGIVSVTASLMGGRGRFAAIKIVLVGSSDFRLALNDAISNRFRLRRVSNGAGLVRGDCDFKDASFADAKTDRGIGSKTLFLRRKVFIHDAKVTVFGVGIEILQEAAKIDFEKCAAFGRCDTELASYSLIIAKRPDKITLKPRSFRKQPIEAEAEEDEAKKKEEVEKNNQIVENEEDEEDDESEEEAEEKNGDEATNTIDRIPRSEFSVTHKSLRGVKAVKEQMDKEEEMRLKHIDAIADEEDEVFDVCRGFPFRCVDDPKGSDTSWLQWVVGSKMNKEEDNKDHDQSNTNSSNPSHLKSSWWKMQDQQGESDSIEYYRSVAGEAEIWEARRPVTRRDKENESQSNGTRGGGYYAPNPSRLDDIISILHDDLESSLDVRVRSLLKRGGDSFERRTQRQYDHPHDEEDRFQQNLQEPSRKADSKTLTEDASGGGGGSDEDDEKGLPEKNILEANQSPAIHEIRSNSYCITKVVEKRELYVKKKDDDHDQSKLILKRSRLDTTLAKVFGDASVLKRIKGKEIKRDYSIVDYVTTINAMSDHEAYRFAHIASLFKDLEKKGWREKVKSITGSSAVSEMIKKHIVPDAYEAGFLVHESDFPSAKKRPKTFVNSRGQHYIILRTSPLNLRKALNKIQTNEALRHLAKGDRNSVQRALNMLQKAISTRYSREEHLYLPALVWLANREKDQYKKYCWYELAASFGNEEAKIHIRNTKKDEGAMQSVLKAHAWCKAAIKRMLLRLREEGQIFSWTPKAEINGSKADVTDAGYWLSALPKDLQNCAYAITRSTAIEAY
eukprot:jgi/Bigna1/84112/fgenesh1_pg.123_\